MENEIRAAIQKCEDDNLDLEDFGLHYYVILTIDVASDTDISWPCGSDHWRKWLKKLIVTEGDDQYDYDYLGGDWEKGKHRKLVGILNQKDFSLLCNQFDLYPEDVETMGSLTEYGLLPAISFNGREDDYSALVNAYITPQWEFQRIDKPASPKVESQENLFGSEVQKKLLEDLLDKLWKLTKERILKKYR